MFGIGGGELIVIILIALVFMGPDKLPAIARSIGKGVRNIKDTGDEIKDQVYRDLKPDLDIVSSIQKEFQSVKKQAEEEIDRIKH